jgi:hypothetical protein
MINKEIKFMLIIYQFIATKVVWFYLRLKKRSLTY